MSKLEGNNFKTIDNYLPVDDHLNLKTIMESQTFPWFYQPGCVWPFKNKVFDYQFVHIFYKNYNYNSNYFENLNPLLERLKPNALIRIKANLNPVNNKIIKSEKHVDQDFKCKVALYYINDNNGYTMIGDKKVESKSNRMVLFNSTQKHYGTNSTNCNNRMVINFNYF